MKRLFNKLKNLFRKKVPDDVIELELTEEEKETILKAGLLRNKTISTDELMAQVITGKERFGDLLVSVFIVQHINAFLDTQQKKPRRRKTK